MESILRTHALLDDECCLQSYSRGLNRENK